MRVPGFAPLYTSLLVGRVSGQMVNITLVLFVLARYHSPQLAGLTAFLASVPGLVVSPIAGALLDRYGRARLVMLDYAIAALTVVLIAVLSWRHALPAPLLLAIVAVSSLTNPLSNSGSRSLFPVLAPRHLWERANALDSGGHVIATLVGAPLAGLLVGYASAEWALTSSGALFAVGALAMAFVHDPSPRSAGGSIVREAWRGLQYVVRNATLRGLALTLSTFNLAWGVLFIAIPVLVLGRLHQGPAAVGFLWGAMGLAGLVSALVTGRIDSRGRERQLMAGAIVVSAVGIALLPFAAALPLVVVAIVIVGAANGPFDVALFTLRQRRTDPAWFGRAFAISMSVNWIGTPVGSALAGPVIAWSLDAALWVAAAVALVSALFPTIAIPARDENVSS
ncbi:MAG TPA: MFS transporter [Candidatus Dormibacteraeota bacterium]|nr:MFS transporter [Candidatus Dormibacteraeota bacterium]